MSLEDGEYELDISVLLQNASTIDTPTSTSKDTSENIAIRYGFIPDSMDQSKPLKLYQKDQTCILKTLSTEGSNKPIFFEGIPQRYHRNSTNSSSSTPNTNNGGNNDSFYLTFNKELNGNVVHLKKLESTIRFNKSRNIVKVQKQVNDMEKEYDRRRSILKNSRLKNNNTNNNDNKDSSLHLPNTNTSSRSTPPIRSTPTTSPLRKPPTAKKTTTKPTTKNQPQSQSQRQKQQASKTVSSKRPPVSSISTPDLKPEQASEPIISESDFEDLEMDDATNDKQHDFPVLEFDFDDDNDNDDKEQDKPLKEEPTLKSKPKTTTNKKPTKPKTTKPKKQTKTKKPIENPDKSMELDDEFKDLEDQLQEVLEEEGDEDEEEEEDIVPADADEIVVETPQESHTNISTIKNVSPTIEVSLSLDNRDDSIIDSDESEFEDFHFTGIKIDEGNSSNGNNNNNTTKKPAFNLNTTGKPRSLRDLVGGGNTPSLADGSSSEEE